MDRLPPMQCDGDEGDIDRCGYAEQWADLDFAFYSGLFACQCVGGEEAMCKESKNWWRERRCQEANKMQGVA